MRAILLAAALTTAAATASASLPVPATQEIRYCGPPARTASGEILRRADVLAAFRKANPCPSTGKTSGACPRWSMDHVWPLACGGCDAVWNIQWLPNALKSAAQVTAPGPKDRWEREIRSTESCSFQVQQ